MKIIKLEEKELEFMATLDTISVRKYLMNKYGVTYDEHVECVIEEKSDKTKEQDFTKSFIDDKLKEEFKWN